MGNGMKCFGVCLIIAILANCQQSPLSKVEAEPESHLGRITYEYTGHEEAQPHFEKGLLLLHSFEYDDAAEEFRKARAIDPDFIMAYWGEIMTYNHALWRAKDHEKAEDVFLALGETREERLAKAKKPIERDLLESVEILYGEGDKSENDAAYAAFMESLHQKYPGNHEIASLYALALLGSVPDGRDEKIYGESALVAQAVLKENPDHPGALHYLIHSYDDPEHAHLAIHAADKYSKVAPDAGHALHMPSHIYIALGMWDEVISSNVAAFDASVKRKARKGLDVDELNYHALHWLMYGYLQTGEDQKARSLLMDMKSYADLSSSKRARGYCISMLGTYLVGTNNWKDNALTAFAIDDAELNIATKSVKKFIEGMVAYTAQDPRALEAVLDTMSAQTGEAQKKQYQKGAKMCSGASGYNALPSQVDVNHAQVMEMELKAMLADLHGLESEAEMWLKKACRLESETSFMYGPPVVVKPSHELYGEWLLSNGQPEQAEAQFKKALERAPKRKISSEGITQCRKLIADL